ncbi:MAG TPA: translation elongation factor-like protein [Candidatus Paceibacterota bacterium]
MLKKILQSLGLAKKKTVRTDKPIGGVTHFYGHLGVAIVKFNRDISTGSKLTFVGPTTDFSQTADSMQMDHKPTTQAPKGKEVGIKVKDKVREGDQVYLD